MSDDLKILKPRIPLKTVFRTSPAERRDYVKGVSKYNRDIREQARLKAMEKAEQDKFLKDFDKSIDRFEQASKIQTKYYYEPAPVIPVPATKSTSSSSSGGKVYRPSSSSSSSSVSNLGKSGSTTFLSSIFSGNQTTLSKPSSSSGLGTSLVSPSTFVSSLFKKSTSKVSKPSTSFLYSK
jgi:hypothetical protein